MAQKEDRRLNSIIGGKWRVDSLLGSGSMASVYGVTHRNGAKAALKILHPTLCTDPKVCERFLGEGYVTNQVKHSGIVRVLDDGMTDDGCVFLVMDLLEGMTLEALRQERGGRMAIDETLDIADALMDALHAVHAAGIIHRDLKPQNVFICENGDVKLLDFGVARVLETSKSRNKMSLFGMVLGTPSFMSPEQATGARDQVDHRADIYSLGATLFTILTGETVHLGPHVQAKLLAAGTTQARSISLVAQDLHPAVANVIDTALRFDKEDRWQSVDAFRRALKEARRAAGLGDAIPLSVRSPVSVRTVPSGRPHMPPAKRSTKRPPGPASRGPARTFAGIGALEAFPAPPAKVPEAKQTLPYFSEPPAEPSLLPEHPAGHTGAAAALPVGIVRAPIPNDVDVEGEEAKSEGSYPAVDSSIRRGADDADTSALMNQLTPKRSGPYVWLTSVGLVAAAIGLVAFYAMGGSTSSNAHDDAAAAAAPATLTSAPAPEPVAAPTSTTRSIPDPPALPARETRDAGLAPPTRPPSALTPPPAWHGTRSSARNPPNQPSFPSPAQNPSTHTRWPASPDPQPVTNPASSAPALAPDPFATPE